MPRRTTVNRSAGATPSLTRSSRTSGLTATSAVVIRASQRSSWRNANVRTGPKFTRRTLILSGTREERVGREAQPFLERHSRLPAEEAPRRGDVGPRVAHVARALGEVLLVDGLAEHLADDVRERVHRARLARRDVQHLAARLGGLGGEHVRLDDVVD